MAESLEKNNHFPILGPCSAESREQVFTIASELKSRFDHFVFRAGVWKPRTSPDSFQGIGSEGIAWMSEVQEQLNIPVTVEVASRAHLEDCFARGIKRFWIGARTVMNPFSVQELADTLDSESEIQIGIKNPLIMDLGLWSGAYERLAKKVRSEKQLFFIHRGFHYYPQGQWRNHPFWDQVTEFRLKFPDAVFVCDPSHMAGTRHLLAGICQTAKSLAYDSFMMEVHHDPDHAWSDAKQQVTPEDCLSILSSLKTNNSSEEDIQEQLCQWRDQIDEIDRSMMLLLSKRREVVRQLSLVKQGKNLSALQIKRFLEMIETRYSWGGEMKIPQDLIDDWFKMIHQDSLALQEINLH
jgi:chorismate mutase